MKALLINGSPHPKGCTYTALEELARTLEAEGIETEIVQAGGRVVGIRNLTMKVGAAVVSCRRGGNTSSFDVLNKYFTISGMPIASSQYWNMVYGNTPEEVRQDREGLQTMRTLGRNMAFLMKAIQLGRVQYGLPQPEPPQVTSFHH